MGKESGEWLSLEQAAALFNHVTGFHERTIYRPISATILRRRIQDNDLQDEGVVCLVMPGRYYISRESFLTYLATYACGVCDRAKEEIARGVPAGVGGG